MIVTAVWVAVVVVVVIVVGRHCDYSIVLLYENIADWGEESVLPAVPSVIAASITKICKSLVYKRSNLGRYGRMNR